MKNPLYSDKLMEHFENPRNVGSFPEGEENVVSGMVGSPACGDTLKLELKIDPETEKIVDVRFKTFGCASAVASSSLLTEWVKGKTVEEALENVKDALAAVVEAYGELGRSLPRNAQIQDARGPVWLETVVAAP